MAARYSCKFIVFCIFCKTYCFIFRPFYFTKQFYFLATRLFCYFPFFGLSSYILIAHFFNLRQFFLLLITVLLGAGAIFLRPLNLIKYSFPFSPHSLFPHGNIVGLSSRVFFLSAFLGKKACKVYR